jgi:3D (Asp-Asp-Asp) domain-containing protein
MLWINLEYSEFVRRLTCNFNRTVTYESLFYDIMNVERGCLMRSLKRIFAISCTSLLLLSTTIVANAETSQTNIQNEIQQNEAIINQKEAEKQNVSNELDTIQNELAELESELETNKENLATMEKQISETQALIEAKKEQIVILEDKVQARKEVMRERLVSMQHTDKMNLVIEILLDSENFTELLNRATAATTILNADKDLFEQQEQDLKQIEEEKAEIDKQEKLLVDQYKSLAANQANIEQTMQKRQEVLAAAQAKFEQVSSEISMAEQEKSALQQKLAQAQQNLQTARQEAAARNQQMTQNTQALQVSAPAGREFYVSATAYSHEETTLDITATGINIKDNANMKLIAVDPSVIPLGSRVWVEGYGEAIAGDTGGAIKGHKIDVLMPSSAAAKSWGRKTVKVVILN